MSACELWERAQQAKRDIDVNGLTVKDRFGQDRPNPALIVERQNVKAFASFVNQLPCRRQGKRPAWWD